MGVDHGRPSFQELEQPMDDAGIELLPRRAAQLIQPLIGRSRRTVATVGGDRRIGVGGGHDPCFERDGVALQSVGVSLTIEALVVMANDRGDLAQGSKPKTIDSP